MRAVDPRSSVEWAKIAGGNRAGAICVHSVGHGAGLCEAECAKAILMSAYRTLKPRGPNPTKTIADALRTYLATGQLPPLPQ